MASLALGPKSLWKQMQERGHKWPNRMVVVNPWPCALRKGRAAGGLFETEGLVGYNRDTDLLLAWWVVWISLGQKFGCFGDKLFADPPLQPLIGKSALGDKIWGRPISVGWETCVEDVGPLQNLWDNSCWFINTWQRVLSTKVGSLCRALFHILGLISPAQLKFTSDLQSELALKYSSRSEFTRDLRRWNSVVRGRRQHPTKAVGDGQRKHAKTRNIILIGWLAVSILPIAKPFFQRFLWVEVLTDTTVSIQPVLKSSTWLKSNVWSQREAPSDAGEAGFDRV